MPPVKQKGAPAFQDYSEVYRIKQLCEEPLPLLALAFGNVLSERLSECSVWTVDIAHVLARHGCAVTFCTVTVGANPDFASERFYQRNMINDRRRVDRLFNEAQKAGIAIQQRSLSWQDIRDCIQTGTNVTKDHSVSI
jgi:hypothetical protein